MLLQPWLTATQDRARVPCLLSYILEVFAAQDPKSSAQFLLISTVDLPLIFLPLISLGPFRTPCFVNLTTWPKTPKAMAVPSTTKAPQVVASHTNGADNYHQDQRRGKDPKKHGTVGRFSYWGPPNSSNKSNIAQTPKKIVHSKTFWIRMAQCYKPCGCQSFQKAKGHHISIVCKPAGASE